MSTISIQAANGIFVTCAHVFPLTDGPFSPGEEFVFEVFTEEATPLEERLSRSDLYAIDNRTYWGHLVTLEPGTSTHTGLALLRHKPVLRGVLRIENVPTASASPSSYLT